jgi:hypothetical protein
MTLDILSTMACFEKILIEESEITRDLRIFSSFLPGAEGEMVSSACIGQP